MGRGVALRFLLEREESLLKCSIRRWSTLCSGVSYAFS